MDYIQYVGAAITFGSVLGGIVAGFFARRQKSLVVLLRESNNDYKERVSQLEDTVDRQDTQIKKQDDEIKQLKAEKALPFENLIKLITKQHAQTNKSIMQLAKAIENSTSVKKGKN